MKQRYVISIMLIIGIVVAIGGCGYTSKIILPSGVKTIYVPNFKNSISQSDQYTYEWGLEIDVTNGVIDRLIYDGNLKVVKKDEADAFLVGEIIGYNQGVVRYTSTDSVDQYRLYVAVKLVFKRRETGEILWTEPNLSGNSEYYVGATTERAAADAAIEDLAKNIVNRIVEDW